MLRVPGVDVLLPSYHQTSNPEVNCTSKTAVVFANENCQSRYIFPLCRVHNCRYELVSFPWTAHVRITDALSTTAISQACSVTEESSSPFERKGFSLSDEPAPPSSQIAAAVRVPRRQTPSVRKHTRGISHSSEPFHVLFDESVVRQASHSLSQSARAAFGSLTSDSKQSPASLARSGRTASPQCSYNPHSGITGADDDVNDGVPDGPVLNVHCAGLGLTAVPFPLPSNTFNL